MAVNAAREAPTVGEHVLVHFGVSDVPGVVTWVYGTGVLARARVRVIIRGPEGEDLGSEEFTLPFNALVRGEQHEPPAPTPRAS